MTHSTCDALLPATRKRFLRPVLHMISFVPSVMSLVPQTPSGDAGSGKEAKRRGRWGMIKASFRRGGRSASHKEKPDRPTPTGKILQSKFLQIRTLSCMTRGHKHHCKLYILMSVLVMPVQQPLCFTYCFVVNPSKAPRTAPHLKSPAHNPCLSPRQ